MDQLTLATLHVWASSKVFVERLWLVGSRARGNHREDSDIDIVVDFRAQPPYRDMQHYLHVHHSNWTNELTYLFDRKVDVLVYETGEPIEYRQEGFSVPQLVEVEGILAYDRRPN